MSGSYGIGQAARAAFGHEFINISETQREPEIEPDCVLDDGGRFPLLLDAG
jgi:hypothetical protein